MAEGGWDGRRRVGRVEQPVVWLKEDGTVGGGWRRRKSERRMGARGRVWVGVG